MAKELSDKDLLSIVGKTIINDEIDDSDTYLNFLEDMAILITKYFGGDVISVKYTKESGYIIYIGVNDSLPEDGGIFAQFDQSVVWKDGKEFNYDQDAHDR